MTTEIQFTLSKPLEYAHNGEPKETQFITLNEPSYKNIEKCVPLKQAFFRVAAEIADSQTVEENTGASDAVMSADDVVMMFYQSSEDMLKVILQAVELFKSPNIALAGGEEKLTTKIIEDMGQDDLERMFGKYMCSFILASVLNKAENK